MSEEKKVLREMKKMIKRLEESGGSLSLCGNCGKAFSKGDQYCSSCGAKTGEKPSIKVKKILLM